MSSTRSTSIDGEQLSSTTFPFRVSDPPAAAPMAATSNALSSSNMAAQGRSDDELEGKRRNIYAVWYESMEIFCKVCGIIGHEHEECDNRVYTEKDLKFGDYLYVDPTVHIRVEWEPSRGDRKIDPDVYVPKQKAGLEEMVEGELKDMATSPLK
ncbi:hypothetical protein D1007_57738 [Hordeum vulgare]|nr:hypothetical protein D1007_57738 [Hordeum vulgare]